MPGLHDSEMPAGIAAIRDAVAAFLEIDRHDEWLMVFDADHEGMSEGSYSIALEGAYEWPWEFTGALYEGKVTAPSGWYMEARTGWSLGCYPVRDETL